MITVTVSVYFCFATLKSLRFDDSGINIIVNLAVQRVFSRVFFAVKNNVNICRAERFTAIEYTAFGKTYCNFVAAFACGIPFKYLFDDISTLRN